MHLLKLLLRKLQSPNTVARKEGVNFGRHCHFRTKNFGSEPYLIEIGDFVTTSRDVDFVTHDGAVAVLRHLYPEHQNIDLIDKIVIRNNVFIGMGAILLPGTYIEDNVIVGARSLIKGRLEANSVYAGIPAKRIGSLEEYLDKNRHKFFETKQLAAKEKKETLLSLFEKKETAR